MVEVRTQTCRSVNTVVIDAWAVQQQLLAGMLCNDAAARSVTLAAEPLTESAPRLLTPL